MQGKFQASCSKFGHFTDLYLPFRRKSNVVWFAYRCLKMESLLQSRKRAHSVDLKIKPKECGKVDSTHLLPGLYRDV